MPTEAERQRLLARDVMGQPAVEIGPGASLRQAAAAADDGPGFSVGL